MGAGAGMAAVAAVKFSAVDVTTILYAFIGFTSCFVVGYLASLVAGGESRSEGLSVRG